MTFNTHAPDRRTLVRALQEHLGIDAVYSGPPTFTYQLGNLTIERDGSITAANVADLKAVGPFLLERGWADDDALSGADVAATVPDLEAASEAEPEKETAPGAEADTVVETKPETTTATDPATETEEAPEVEAPADLEAAEPEVEFMDISIPAELTVEQLRNLIFMLHSKQYLLNRSFGKDCISIPKQLVDRLADSLPDATDDFQTILEDADAKESIQGFDFKAGVVTMRFPFNAKDSLPWVVYADLMNRILQAAKEATRVNPEVQMPENEKFTFRGWLLRLGYKGSDSKAARHLLMVNLKGNSAFPDESKATAHRDKYAAIRREQRAAAKAKAERATQNMDEAVAEEAGIEAGDQDE